jgi:drug/metabolite transporter (DMT)-like permease
MDVFLVLMVVVWGLNYSALKRAFQEIPPPVFNTLRLVIASSVFLMAIRIARKRAAASRSPLASVFYTPQELTRRDRWDLVWLGLVGHLAYQLCFVNGLARTTASNGALIFGATPVVVALLSAALGRERVGRLHWIGAALSAAGIYFVVGHGATLGSTTFGGDLLIGLGVICWAAYTIGGMRLMARHSPLFVTGMTMAIGTIPYAIWASPRFAEVNWAAVTPTVWGLLLFGSLGAFCFSYLVWYAAVKQLGPARTSIYSNAIPIVAMVFAALWLGEPITGIKMLGALAVITGVVLTRLSQRLAGATVRKS